MRLFYSLASPFVRRVLVAAIELGLRDRIEIVDVLTTPINPDPQLFDVNPVRKIPALETDDGQLLFDTPVITEYLNDLAGGSLLPATGAARWTVKRQEAMAAGLLDAAVLTRYEGFLRPEALRWDEWTNAQLGKIEGALTQMDADVASFGDEPTLGQIAFGCACGYLDFRFTDMPWREKHGAVADWYASFSERPSMKATAPS